MTGAPIRLRRGHCAVLVVLFFPSSSQLDAQAATRNMPAASRSDSVAWQRVLVFVIRSLSEDLVRVATDTARQPWDLRLPPAEPQRQLLEAQLRSILRARAPRSTDSVTRTLELGEMRIVNDTALVKLQVQTTVSCPGTTRTTGWGSMDTVRVPRFPQHSRWGVAFSRATLIGDRFGC